MVIAIIYRPFGNEFIDLQHLLLLLDQFCDTQRCFMTDFVTEGTDVFAIKDVMLQMVHGCFLCLIKQ